MLRTRINISRYDFDKIEYDNSDRSEIILYITTSGKDLPEVKIKCVIEKALFVEDSHICHNVGMRFDQFLKDQIEKDFKVKEIKDYSLGLSGFIAGIENVITEGSEESEDYILFNVLDAAIIRASLCNDRLV